MYQANEPNTVMNFLEEEDYEELTAPPLSPTSVAVKAAQSAVQLIDEDWAEVTSQNPILSSEQRQPARRNMASGRRITEGNAELIHFLSKFPGATSEALSLISARKDRAAAGQNILPSVKGTENRLRKIASLGAVEAVRNPLTTVVQHSATQLGIDGLWTFGYNTQHAATLHKKAQRRLEHYRYIAQVAAQFASPHGFFRDSLGIDPVPVELLVSENEMRGAYEPIKEWLKDEHSNGRSGDYGKWRDSEMQIALAEAAQGRLAWSDIVHARPALLTIGEPQIKTTAKAVHQPDLAVVLDADRRGSAALNLLVEVELSKKSWHDYRDIFLTYKAELEHGFVYDRIVYFGLGTQVETLLRKVDAHYGFKLFSSGKFIYLPITDRNGDPIRSNDRITLGAN